MFGFNFRSLGKFCLIAVFAPFFLVVTAFLACICRLRAPQSSLDARIVFGPSPIINNKYWARALQEGGL